jgi:hypothetical protein
MRAKPSFVKRDIFEVRSIVLAALSLAAVSCGRTPDVAPPAAPPTTQAQSAIPPVVAPVSNNMTGCSSGLTSLPGSACFPVAEFASRCQFLGGSVVTVGGAQVCRATIRHVSGSVAYDYFGYPIYSGGSYSETLWNMIPVLSPSASGVASNVSGARSYPSVILRKGDRLSFQGSGGWSAQSYERLGSGFGIYTGGSFLGFSLGFGDTYVLNANCQSSSVDVSLDGRIRQKGVTTSEVLVSQENQQMAGLFGSDGTEVFPVGSSLRSKVIQNDGFLRLGFNTLQNYQGCSVLVVRELTVQRCQDVNGSTVDAAGNPYSCF